MQTPVDDRKEDASQNAFFDQPGRVLENPKGVDPQQADNPRIWAAKMTVRGIRDGALRWLRLDIPQLFLSPRVQLRLLQGTGLVEVLASIPAFTTDSVVVPGPFVLLSRGKVSPVWHPDRSVENVVLGSLLEAEDPEGAVARMVAHVLAR